MKMFKALTLSLFIISFHLATAQNKAKKEMSKFMSFMEQGNYDSAEESINKVIKKAKKENKSKYTYLKGLVFHVQNDTAKARKVYESIDSNSKYYYKLAQSMITVIDKEPENQIAIEKQMQRDKVLKEQLDSLGSTKQEVELKEKKDSTSKEDIVESFPYSQNCKKFTTNPSKKRCFNEEMQKHIAKNFNTGLASDLGLYGKIKIISQFIIDKQGNITAVQVYNKNAILRLEAKRIINLIPQMTPGFQNDKPVEVRYKLPIVFMVTG